MKGVPGRSAFLCDSKAAVDPGPAPLQRLTPAQYTATAHDLFGTDLDLAGVLPAEVSASHIGLAQPDPSLVDVENYAAAARRVREQSEGVAEQARRLSANPRAQQSFRDFLTASNGSIDVAVQLMAAGRTSGSGLEGRYLQVEVMLESDNILDTFVTPELISVTAGRTCADPMLATGIFATGYSASDYCVEPEVAD